MSLGSEREGRVVMRRLGTLLAVGAALALPRSAPAALDPGRADADVQQAMSEKAYAFCSAPREPLSSRALELCPSATSIPECKGFVAACAKANDKEPQRAPQWNGRWRAIAGALGALAQAVVWLVVAALLLAVLIPIARALLRSRRPDEPPTASPEPARSDSREPAIVAGADEEALLRRAAELAARGENAVALELYLAASLRALEKRGAIRVAPERTNGEYVRACVDATAKPALREIVSEVERVKFGGETAGTERVSRAARRAFSIVRALPIALSAAALLSAGCGEAAGGPLSRRPGDDPASLELFRDVLHAQGLQVEPLGSSLASMPLPAEAPITPAVVVDVDRTPLDEESSAHLVAWVEAGGVLVLAGSPADWPAGFGAVSAASTARAVTARTLVGREDAPDDDLAPGAPDYERSLHHGQLALSGRGLQLQGAFERAAWLDDEATYAAVFVRGRGQVLAIATDELLTNAGLARPGNAAAMISILSNAGREAFAVADADDGVSPPSTPLAAIVRAGLGIGLAHALVAAAILFLAAGTRLARPHPAAPPLRRAFAEHVEAVGSLYSRTSSAPHALAAFARFADERLRARLPRQTMTHTTDIAAFLASRAGAPLESCQRVWARATAALDGAPPQGDELSVLGQLAALVSAATAREP